MKHIALFSHKQKAAHKPPNLPNKHFSSLKVKKAISIIMQKFDESHYCIYFAVIVLLWRLCLLGSFSPYQLYPDSETYLTYPWQDLFHFRVTSGRTPVYPAFLALMRFFFGEEYFLRFTVVIQAVLSFLSLFLLYRTIYTVSHRPLLSNLATSLYGLCPDVIVWDNAILTESLALSLTVLLLYLLVRFLYHPNFKTGSKLTLLCFLMIFERPTFLLFAALLFGFWILRLIFCSSERRLLFKLCALSILCFVGVGLYAISFKQHFGFYSISDAMARQNVVTSIMRGYYKYSSDPKWINAISFAMEQTGGDAWKVYHQLITQFGLIKSSALAKESIFAHPLVYVYDTLRQMLTDAPCNYGEYYISNAMQYTVYQSSYIQTRFLIVKALYMIFEWKIGWIYFVIPAELLMFCKKRKCFSESWLHLGLFVFLLLIPISTYIATCGEFARTMIHILPFFCVSSAAIMDTVLTLKSENISR